MTTAMAHADTIDAGQFRRLMSEDPDLRVLDVRTGGEYETVHIPGSYNVPLDTLREHVGDLAEVSHPVVLVCQSGGRATQAHETLVHAGKNSLHVLEGGMNQWVATGGDVIRSTPDRWAMDRQVRLAAGAMTLTAIIASIVAPKMKWLGAAVAAGLVYSAVSNTCAMAGVLAKLPYNRGNACDIASVLEDLNREGA